KQQDLGPNFYERNYDGTSCLTIRPISKSLSHTLNQANFSSTCRNSADSSASAKVGVFLGPLRQDASGKDPFGAQVTLESCNVAIGRIRVETTVRTTRYWAGV